MVSGEGLSKAWSELLVTADDPFDLRVAFATDESRAERYSFQAGDLFVDFSKNLISDAAVDHLLSIARFSGLQGATESMFVGEPINTTEDRAVLHTLLRARADDPVPDDLVDDLAAVHGVLRRMAALANSVRSGEWRGYTDKSIESIVNIGIGGSDLGPAMATRALQGYLHPGLAVHFVSNVDPADIMRTLDVVDPETTLFIVASKTFSTLETLANATAARQWLVEHAGSDSAVPKHFVALSTSRERVVDFGIEPSNMFEFWEWVGGRYSMCSAIGLSLMIGIGPDGFHEMLDGFRTIDEHFRSAPFERNIPVLLGLIGVYYRNVLKLQTHAVIPYAQDLERFPAYLQQLDMESNGKRTTLEGDLVSRDSAPIVWGEPGTNGQHAFFQMLHQGTTVVPIDFVGFANAESDPGGLQELLVANMFAQSGALAFGKTTREVVDSGVEGVLANHRTFPGNRPSTTILAPALTPSTLGQLVALYEHKVFTQGVVWGINSFDQWGVELGKDLAGRVHEDLGDAPAAFDHDASTNVLIAKYRELRNN